MMDNYIGRRIIKNHQNLTSLNLLENKINPNNILSPKSGILQ